MAERTGFIGPPATSAVHVLRHPGNHKMGGWSSIVSKCSWTWDLAGKGRESGHMADPRPSFLRLSDCPLQQPQHPQGSATLSSGHLLHGSVPCFLDFLLSNLTFPVPHYSRILLTNLTFPVSYYPRILLSNLPFPIPHYSRWKLHKRIYAGSGSINTSTGYWSK